jgi:predicted transposase YdaD
MLLDLHDAELKQTRFYQEVFAEGLEEGWEEGRKEGHNEGRHGATLELVRRQLRRRLGPLSGATEERLAALSVAQLEDLGEALLDFAQPSDLADWLRHHPQ